MWHAVYSNRPFYVEQLENIRVNIEKTYVENKENRVQRLLSQGPRTGRPTQILSPVHSKSTRSKSTDASSNTESTSATTSATTAAIRRAKPPKRLNKGKRAESGSKEPKICWYHKRFGSDSRKCIKPCSFNQKKKKKRDSEVAAASTSVPHSAVSPKTTSSEHVKTNHSCITSSFRLLIKDRLNSLKFLLDTGSEVSVHSPTEANKRNGTSSDLTSLPLPQEQRESDLLLILNKNFRNICEKLYVCVIWCDEI
ncbi:hypothetical protein RDWZM_010556 [Blomia tropicalis]|uniref:Peptidase A2 domain-containing protein n=1 Tax=Blomia tropicalis TaxID=40697 RepID=A0A9Q0RK81_BLOTA|nr:hypothetical protein RDWZM_010556 [Blomia tropicalis]